MSEKQLRTFQTTRQAVLNGELTDEQAINALAGAGWTVEAASATVWLWAALSILRWMQGERSSDGENGSTDGNHYL